MRRIILLVSIIFIMPLASSAKGVDIASAKNIASNFYSEKSNNRGASVNSQSLNLSLAYKYVYTIPSSHIEENLYYVFNIGNADGFVVVAGDDAVIPILGYSIKGSYDNTNLCPAFKSWMDGYIQQIQFIINNNISATDEIKASWSEWANRSNTHRPQRIGSVNPLLTTTWNQGNTDASINGYYNNLCPIDNSLPDADNLTKHCPTGCVATAMAQIMKYWNYPTSGTGIHSYSTTNYGTLSANFGATMYNWSAMPDNVTSANTAVATLMYQCGVSVNMQYGLDGSGAEVIADDDPICAQNSYVQYFGYKSSTIQGLKRSAYTDAAWISLLENELNNGRPVQYAGYGNGDGHTFVFDGFDANDYFHVNWGWSGICDGYFEIDALNPAILGAGGGSGEYNSNQEAVIGIEPASGGVTPLIVMNSNITITPNPINFAQSFSVNFDVDNAGTTNFNGVYCAALFDASGNFIAFIDSLSTGGNPLLPGYHYVGGLTLTNTLLTVPGNYIVGVYYKPVGGNWILIGNTSGNYYTNPANITILGPSNLLELNSNIVSTPTTFVQGQSASVNVNFVNTNSYTYYGQYEAALYDLAGNFVETIGTYSETTGLPSNYTYNSPYITFSTSNVTATPGTYILAILEEESGSSDWYIAGADYFQNPVNINVVAPILPPDVYEPDNTSATAHDFSLNWSNNTATIHTTGSNINSDTDVDYYSINLSTGYTYTVTASADDNQNSSYTGNVLWSYDTGSGWSSSYEDIMPGNIIINGTGKVTFYVAPYFAGYTGTYLLNITVKRAVSTDGINPIASTTNDISVYPNPNNGQMNIALNGKGYSSLKIYDILGKEIYSQPLNDEQIDRNLHIDIDNVKSGVYLMMVTTQQGGVIYRKMILQ